MIFIINTIINKRATTIWLPFKHLHFWIESFAICFFRCRCMFTFMTYYVNCLCTTFITVRPKFTVIYLHKTSCAIVSHLLVLLSLTKFGGMILFVMHFYSLFSFLNGSISPRTITSIFSVIFQCQNATIEFVIILLLFHLKISFILFAGFPPTIVYGATSLVTTDLAAMIAPSPIFIPHNGCVHTNQTSFPITVSPL